jgi:hypothetical protein
MDTRCAICGLEEPSARNLQVCYGCGATFHLNPRSDVVGIDCGDAWLGESLGLEYHCRICIELIERDAAAAHGGPAAALSAQLMHMVTPGVAVPPPRASEGAASPPPGRPSEAVPPPRRTRQARPRRYRRLDT